MSTIREYANRFPGVSWIRTRLNLDDQQQSQNLLAILFMIPPIIFLAVIALFPVLYTLYISVTDLTIFAEAGEFVGLSKYAELMSDSLFWHSIWTGVIFAIGSTALQVIIGLSLALILNKQFRGSSLAVIFAIFPYLVPTIAVAVMWQWMLSPLYGVVNSLAVTYGLFEGPVAFFEDASYAMGAVIFANSWKFASFAFIIFIARLQAIDGDLYEQAKVLGASPWQQFRDITLPNLWSAILLVVFIRTIWMFNRFDIVWLLTRGGPMDSTTTIPVYIYRVTFNQYDIALGSAAAITLFGALSIFAIIYFKVFTPSEEVETRG